MSLFIHINQSAPHAAICGLSDRLILRENIFFSKYKVAYAFIQALVAHIPNFVKLRALECERIINIPTHTNTHKLSLYNISVIAFSLPDIGRGKRLSEGSARPVIMVKLGQVYV